MAENLPPDVILAPSSSKDGFDGKIRESAHQAGCESEVLVDFCTEVNPLGPPDCLRQVISRRLTEVLRDPDPHCRALREALGSAFSVPAEQVVCGNGFAELLHALPRALGASRAVIPAPSCTEYSAVLGRAGVSTAAVLPDGERGFSVDWSQLERELRGGEMVIVSQPARATGAMLEPAALVDLADRHPSTFFVVDETFAAYLDNDRSLASHGCPNVVILRSLSEFYAIPGLPLGCVLAADSIAARVSGVLPPRSLGGLTQAVGVALIEDRAYADRTRRKVAELRRELHRDLAGLGGITVVASAANYLLARVERKNLDAAKLARGLLARKIAIRVCDADQGLDDRYFRIAVRTAEENGRLVDAIRGVISLRAGRGKGDRSNLPGRPEGCFAQIGPVPFSGAKGRRTPAVMFQGTSSDAGKSVLTAAFCRILLEDGYRAAPFKAQNMSLNSYVTRDGGEIGRAQVVQAQACRLDPEVRMNPVLLKPNSDTGSQVIVLGKPVGNMDVSGYIDYKPRAFEAVKAAYTSLADEADVMVIEGAGSPGEVNLKHHDIVNMTMADFAGAPVLLVGDIDRGGVFASFLGTLEVLSERERAMVAGFVINRFRGKRELLGDAIEYVRRHTGLPTFGVIPYIQDLGLPEEDSVSFKARGRDAAPRRADQVEIAVIDLPHISNFTDFSPLESEPDVCLRIVREAGQLAAPDAVMIPGSKNVPGDLAFLRGSGLAERMVELGRKGATICGICGGLQMLGESIEDPYGIESDVPCSRALGLLPIRTVLEREKTLQAVTARHVASGLELRGYEIHHGRTTGEGLRPAVVRDGKGDRSNLPGRPEGCFAQIGPVPFSGGPRGEEDGRSLGYASPDGRVFGTYLHGLFDADRFRRWFIDDLRRRRGLPALGAPQTVFDIEPALNRVADLVRANLDVDAVYRRMGLK